MKSRIALAVALLMIVGCPKGAPPTAENAPSMSTTTTTTPSPSTDLTGPRVIFPDGFAVHVELAIDDETRAQGLMYRDQLRPATGMLFLFPLEGEYPFWMKNTLIPLDMIWIDSQLHVAHVKFEVPPCKADPCPSYPPNAKAKYVLEVAGGVAKQHGLKAGDVLRYEGMDHVMPR